MPRHNPYSNVPIAPLDLDLNELRAGRNVEIDIGFGRGHFILDRAAEKPEALLIGLEMRRKWVALAAERAERRGLTNVIAWYGDARQVLPTWGPDGTLSTIFVNFPDPWWKKKHAKRRVVTAASVREFARLLRPGGHLLVQTDVLERGADYRNTLLNEPSLIEAMGGAAEPLDFNPLGTPSHREKKCLDAGLQVCRLFFKKVT